ncbi:sensor protein GtcS [Peptoclostridium acidaminophilum DSM 3953]|uniref:histidine kinase n=1 Tax=Peptoclostridium acidaminophilum DSM 3953 TaxID=1286171 RepID=W8T1G6_PEPAC|nr:HAMP domain-containing sensor histidine kinase [Peptoclostridium acidaminophilum]AHM55584.1 sensor protein GtcS [Peptoclostridium acidaminophilum DSM 3953]
MIKLRKLGLGLLNRKISISTQFFLNYLILFFLMIAVTVTTSFFGFSYVEKNIEPDDIDLRALHNSIIENGMEKACKKYGVADVSYVEILDSNFRVTQEYNSPHSIGYTYPKENMLDLMLSDTPHYKFLNVKEQKSLVLFASSAANSSAKAENVMQVFLKTFTVSLIMVLLIYAKITSSLILSPINRLLLGVKTISAGDYSTRIKFSSKNEFEDLRDAVNQMAQKIENEINLREDTEANRKNLVLYISHDLKTPLTNILGYCETLKNEKNLPQETVEKYLDIIIANARRANSLIQDLFELSRLGTESATKDFERLDICEVTREIIINYIDELEQNDMKYDFDIPDHPVECLINPKQLERAIGNIINNSIKYSGKGTGLFIKLKATDEYAFIIVRDTGAGISADFKGDLFEPFVRGESSRNSRTGGTGLGLAITQKIIENHNGRIILDSSYSKGCKFIIMLPILKGVDS